LPWNTTPIPSHLILRPAQRRQLLPQPASGCMDSDELTRVRQSGRQIIMPVIFISYRRDDSSGWALHLSENLRSEFGDDQIFTDIETIEPGMKYTEFIEKSLGSIKVLLAVIGPHWLTATDRKTGRLRLDDPRDLLRVEIATALKDPKIQVIPVLVGGATMPAVEDLPEDLRGLAGRDTHEMTDTRWTYDQEQLIKTLRKLIFAKNEDEKNIKHDVSKQEIKDPRPKGRGISEQSELALLVQLPVA
jgi:hypothetical protein